jgi:multidrug/hemolysin transport system ATP-binding protein
MDNMIEIKSLSKNYNDLTAVKDISFNVKKGNLFAFLGPNGAGKSTTIGMICTILKPTTGKILVNGYEVGIQDDEIRNSIGVVFQESLLDPLLTVRENLRIRASFYNINKVKFNEILKEISIVIGIEDFLDQRYGTLSGGQKRRADIARALLNHPKLLILDEPTTGLDPQTRLNVWKTIKKIQKEQGMTVLLTTHYMEEAVDADQVVIIDHGQVVAQDTPEHLRLLYSQDTLRITPKNMLEFTANLQCEYSLKDDMVIIPIKNSLEGLQYLKQYEANITSFEVIRGNMDDVFVNITGHQIR